MYYVNITAKNRAGLSVDETSRPILADFSRPVAGKVMDGVNFTHDVMYWPTRNTVSGSEY